MPSITHWWTSLLTAAVLLGWTTPLVHTLSVATTSRTPATDSKQAPSRQTWYPTRIQDVLPYEQVVERLYVRHIVVETAAVAQTIVPLYMNDYDKHADPFAVLARTLSACEATRDAGGTIGWLDRTSAYEIIPAPVVQELFAKHPKAGDVYTIESPTTKQYHIVQVLQLWTKMLETTEMEKASDPSDDQQTSLIGGLQGTNRIQRESRTFKGSGVRSDRPTDLTSYAIHTSGCQMNVADSEKLAGLFGQMGLVQAQAEQKDASIVLFHTCSIRDKAESKLYDALGVYAARKRRGESCVLLVTGCVAQQEGEALVQRCPEVDAVLGPQYIPFLPKVVEHVQEGHQLVLTAPLMVTEDHISQPPIRTHDVRAWVNVIHGCNEHCTYCVVPSTRGMETSRTMESILEECTELAARGYKEVTLLGQNIDAYGRDMVPKRSFAQLLEYLDRHLPVDNFRIRYVTSHPRYFSDRVVDAVANCDKVCECFHMPFQAGDDQVLRRMRRGYTCESYMRIIRRIKAAAPDASISADIIVGFPGETDEAFEKTLQLMEEVQFDNVNSFAYSPRPNTEAALWEDQIDEQTKAERLQRVQQLANQHGLQRSQRYLGRTVEVLVEDGNPKNSEQVMGRTRQGRQVYFDGDLDALRGEFVQVEVTEARTWSLMGRLVSS